MAKRMGRYERQTLPHHPYGTPDHHRYAGTSEKSVYRQHQKLFPQILCAEQWPSAWRAISTRQGDCHHRPVFRRMAAEHKPIAPWVRACKTHRSRRHECCWSGGWKRDAGMEIRRSFPCRPTRPTSSPTCSPTARLVSWTPTRPEDEISRRVALASTILPTIARLSWRAAPKRDRRLTRWNRWCWANWTNWRRPICWRPDSIGGQQQRKRTITVHWKTNRSLANYFVDAFINGKKWDDVVTRPQPHIGHHKKFQIVAFANKYFDNGWRLRI